MPIRLAPDLRPLTPREEKLDILLTYYQDVCVADNDGAIGGGGNLRDSRILALPLAWNMSYRELDRALQRMRTLAEPGIGSPLMRGMYVHLCEWYFKTSRRPVPIMEYDAKTRAHRQQTKQVCRTCWEPWGHCLHPEYEHVPQTKLDITRRNGDPRYVMLALEWIGKEFVGDVWLPEELLKVSAAAA